MSFFYGVYPADRAISRLFDLARLIVQPDFARKAHITLRGPYDERPSPKSKWLRLNLSDATLLRPSTFFNDFQNTVYLGVSIIEMDDIAWKPDFSGGTPHLSIYDGRDRVFAWQVLEVLREFPWKIDIELTPVLILEKKREFSSSFFLELDEVDVAFEYIAERPLRREYIRNMHVGQRIYYLRKICETIHLLGRE